MNSGGHWGNRTRISPALGESRADNEGDVTEGVHGRRHYGTEVFELSPSVLGWAESVLGLADPPLRIVKSRESAEELTVDVFHDVWTRAGGYRPDGGTVIGWIMNQARSRAIDRLRFENRKKRTNSHCLGQDSGNEADAAEEVLEARDQERRLKEALADLTPPEREAIETALFSEYTYHETAMRLKLVRNAVKNSTRCAGLRPLSIVPRGVVYES